MARTIFLQIGYVKGIIGLCGVQRRAVERWFDGTREVSAPALRLLVLVDQVPGVRSVLEALDADAPSDG